jgi:hypothetical protein
MGLFDKFTDPKPEDIDQTIVQDTEQAAQRIAQFDRYGGQPFNPMQEKNSVNPLTQNATVQEAADYYGRGQAAINANLASQPEELYNADTGEVSELVTAPQAVTPQGGDIPMTPVIKDARAPVQPGMLDNTFDVDFSVADTQNKQQTGMAAKDKMSGEEVKDIEEPSWLKRYRTQAEERVQADIDQREGYIRSLTPGMLQYRYDPARAYAGMIYNQVCHDSSPDTQAALGLYQTAVTQYGHSVVKLRTAYEQSTAIKEAVNAAVNANLARASQQYFGAGQGSWQMHAADEIVDTSEHTKQGIAFISASDKDRANLLQTNFNKQQENVDEVLEKLKDAPDRMKTRVTSGAVQSIHTAIMSGSLDLNQGVGMLSNMSLNDSLWSVADLAYADALEQQYGMNHDAARRMMVGMRIPAVREHIVELNAFNQDPNRDPMSKKKAFAFCSAVFNSRDLAAAYDLLGTRDEQENAVKFQLIATTVDAMKRMADDNLRQYIKDPKAKSNATAAITAFTASPQVINPITGQMTYVNNSDVQANAAESAMLTIEQLQGSKEVSDRITGQYYQNGFAGIKNTDAVLMVQEGANSLPPGDAAIMRLTLERMQTNVNSVLAGLQQGSPELMQELQKAITAISKGEKPSEQIMRHLTVEFGVSDVSTIASAILDYKRANAITDKELSKDMVTAAMIDHAVRDASSAIYTLKVDNTFLADQMAKGYIRQISPGAYQQVRSKNTLGYELMSSADGTQYSVRFKASQAAAADITKRCSELVTTYMATPRADGSYRAPSEVNILQLQQEIANQLASSPTRIAMYKLALSRIGVDAVIRSSLELALNNAKQIIGDSRSRGR